MQRHNLHERGPNFSRFQAKAAGASSEKPLAARPACEIAGPERAPFNEIVARCLKAIGDPRKVVRDPEARYFGGRVDEHSLVPLARRVSAASVSTNGSAAHGRRPDPSSANWRTTLHETHPQFAACRHHLL
jgi:uncharacterized protein YbjT (DUF2867 family)